MRGLKRAQDIRQPVERAGRQRYGGIVHSRRVTDLVCRRIQLPKHLFHVFEKPRTVLVQANATPLPIEQWNANLPFEPVDGLAE